MEPKTIIYFGQPARVDCDRNCSKAWGINSRPRIHLSENEDDIEWFADSELSKAPTDPGTYEGGDAKPLSPAYFPNKWCVRECERCAMTSPGKFDSPLILPDFSIRRRNIQYQNAE